MRIMRLWLGPDPMPADYAEFGARWSVMNPDCSVWDYDLDYVLDHQWQNQAVIDDILKRVNGKITPEAATQIADVVGYELIYENGGLYLNVDIEPVKSLEYLYDYYQISANTAFAAREDHTTPRIVNAVMGGPLQHPFWKLVMDDLHDRYFHDPTAEMVSTTGPALLTDTYYSGHRTSFHVLPTESFNPVHWSMIPAGGDIQGWDWAGRPGVIGVHHWGHRRTGRTNLVR